VHTRLLGQLAASALAAVLVTRAAAAELPPPGSIPDYTGPRTLALSSGIGIASGNEGIYVNPAALAARKRYSIDASTLIDRRGADTVGQFFGSSVVDSQSAPVTAAISYLRAQKGPYTGNIFHLALGGPVMERLYVGATVKYLSLKGPVQNVDDVTAATVDAGLFWQVADYVSLGAVGYNLVPIGNDAVGPRAVGAGIGVGSDESIQVTADWRADFDRTGKTTNRYGVGAEWLLLHLVPLRAGFQKDETLDTQWWSAGAGFVSRSGLALEVGYRQSTKTPSARTIAASIRVFLFD
jgi:hypothetical protein